MPAKSLLSKTLTLTVILAIFWFFLFKPYRKPSDIVPGQKCKFQKVCWSVSRLLLKHTPEICFEYKQPTIVHLE
jgi:hypothetical protein